MKKMIIRFAKLIIGTAIFTLGVVITMKANLGYAPWEAFHAGIAKATGMTIGNISILVSLLICLVVVMLKETFGLGAIINLFLVGVLIDLFLPLNFIPQADGYVPRIVILIIGLFITALGTYIYISAEFGVGPRDSLMVAIKRKTRFSIGLCRGLVEATAVWIGWILGGPVGLGTVMSALGISFCIQIIFTIMRFEATAIQHQSVQETIRYLQTLFKAAP